MSDAERGAAGVPVARWLEKAEGDLRVARTLLTLDERILPSIIGFHAQQAIEKYLKAVLVAEGVRFPRKHSITDLRNLLRSVPLVAHLPVTRFAVLERYPRLEEGDSDEPSREEVVAAVEYAEDVRRAVTQFLQDSAASNGRLSGERENG